MGPIPALPPGVARLSFTAPMALPDFTRTANSLSEARSRQVPALQHRLRHPGRGLGAIDRDAGGFLHDPDPHIGIEDPAGSPDLRAIDRATSSATIWAAPAGSSNTTRRSRTSPENPHRPGAGDRRAAMAESDLLFASAHRRHVHRRARWQAHCLDSRRRAERARRNSPRDRGARRLPPDRRFTSPRFTRGSRISA